jgi:hypothetical protein
MSSRNRLNRCSGNHWVIVRAPEYLNAHKVDFLARLLDWVE